MHPKYIFQIFFYFHYVTCFFVLCAWINYIKKLHLFIIIYYLVICLCVLTIAQFSTVYPFPSSFFPFVFAFWFCIPYRFPSILLETNMNKLCSIKRWERANINTPSSSTVWRPWGMTVITLCPTLVALIHASWVIMSSYYL